MIRGRYMAYAGVSAPDSILGRVGFGIQVLVARREWCAECQDSRMEKDEAAERPATVSIVGPHFIVASDEGSRRGSKCGSSVTSSTRGRQMAMSGLTSDRLLRSPGAETKGIWPGSRVVSAAESEPARPCRLLQALRRLSRPLA